MDFTDLLEKYLPDYYKNKQVLELDILTRFFEKEELSIEDMEWIDSLWHMSDVWCYYQQTTEQLATQALREATLMVRWDD